MRKELSTELVKEIKKLQVYLSIKKQACLNDELEYLSKKSGSSFSNCNLDTIYEVQEMLINDINEGAPEDGEIAQKYIKGCDKILDFLDPSSDFNFFLKDNPRASYESWLEEMCF